MVYGRTWSSVLFSLLIAVGTSDRLSGKALFVIACLQRGSFGIGLVVCDGRESESLYSGCVYSIGGLMVGLENADVYIARRKYENTKKNGTMVFMRWN